MFSVSDGDSPFVSVLTQRDCPRLTHFPCRERIKYTAQECPGDTFSNICVLYVRKKCAGFFI